MKTIEVTDEIYEFLVNLSNELNTQDHRGTRMPYIFQIQTQEQVAVPEGQGVAAWHMDGHTIETNAEIKEAVIEFKEWDESTTEFNDLDEDEIDEILLNIGYFNVNYEYKSQLENAFFTSKACDEHISVNGHNLNSPRNYLSGAYRNPELEMLLKFLCELTGGNLHR